MKISFQIDESIKLSKSILNSISTVFPNINGNKHNYQLSSITFKDNMFIQLSFVTF